MIRNLAYSWMLAVTLMIGVTPHLPSVAATPLYASAPAAAVVSGGAPAAQVVAVELSRAEMDAVQGGILNWLKSLKTFLTTLVTIVGAVITIVTALKSLFTTTTTAPVAGGETLERTENQVENYNSYAEYYAGTPSSVVNQGTTDWVQTEVWYDSGCGGAGGRENSFYEQQHTHLC